MTQNPTMELQRDADGPATEHFDVLIVGAGVSGIGAAHHLRTNFPDRTFAMLEAQESFGGTWLTHRYPGARSDSDLFTYGYRHKPWTGPSIADGASIREYLESVIDEDGLADHIRYGHRVTGLEWSSPTSTWTATVVRGDTGQTLRITASFLWMCHGYYDHETSYRPHWPDEDRYEGVLLHPQHWPEDLDYAGKRVLIIGSGSTATTLAPALARDAEHVTMLQRSPSYYYIAPKVHELAEALAPLKLPDDWMHEILRRQYIHQTDAIVTLCRENPEEARELVIESIRPHVPADVDFDRHFSPRYRPWQQRVVSIPDGDFFEQMQAGNLSVETDTIERFTESGVQISSGEVLDADIVVAATGLNMASFANIPFCVDGEPVDFSNRITWRGIMISGIPNMAFALGYFRYSWTLRVDIVNDLVTRILGRMAEAGADVVTPTVNPEDDGMAMRPWVDPENVSAGYMVRALDRLYKQSDRDPWRQMFEYDYERELFPIVDLDDGLRFS
ncbi:NAD(P)/FAD-dependent oxidoreductase [Brevibacterium daeguense]|uniref:NAD(P)/FAD-dependent oxidoreductase n=1 Tax=Brevibacterium daeguense TaxID=909936 RepID=A0ABP8EIJ4_9MICO|nr:NAD(P)/FAD-dependent oxidoreductase [Brevibacterium daeguense]